MNHLLRRRLSSSFRASSGVRSCDALLKYGIQPLAIARWDNDLHRLTTPIHEISGLGTMHYRNRAWSKYYFLLYALCSMPLAYWLLRLLRLERCSHSCKNGAPSLKAQGMSRERLGISDRSKNSAIFAKTFPNPQFAILIPQSHLGLAWFLQIDKTTKIGRILKQG